MELKYFAAVYAFSSEKVDQIVGEEMLEVEAPSKQFFPLIHFYLNGIPSNLNLDCVLIIPLREILNSVVHVHPLHTYALGNILIPENATFITPKHTKVSKIGKQPIDNYSPLEQTLQQKIEQFFSENDFLNCNFETMQFQKNNLDVLQLDLYSEIFKVNPNISFGEPKWSLNTERSIVGLFEIANLFPSYLQCFSKYKTSISEKLQQGTSIQNVLHFVQQEYLYGLNLLQNINSITFRVSNMYTLPQSSKQILKQHRTTIIAPLNQLFNTILKQITNWEEHEELNAVTDLSKLTMKNPELFRFWDADRLEDYMKDYSIGSALSDAENMKNIFFVGFYILRLVMFYKCPANTLFATERESIEKRFTETLSQVKLEDNTLHLHSQYGTGYVTLLQEVKDYESILQQIFQGSSILVQID